MRDRYSVTLKSYFWPNLDALVMIYDLLETGVGVDDYTPENADDNTMAYILDNWLFHFDAWDQSAGHHLTLPKLKKLVAQMEDSAIADNDESTEPLFPGGLLPE